MSKKLALISVYDKTGIVEFARRLVEEFDYEIISTGGTRETLKEANIKTKSIKSLTDFPEILDGRVKTLHPAVHGGILARRDNKEHLSTLKKHDINTIDLVVINLYPFIKVAKNTDAAIDELIENIDIGGPTLLRSAAKNHEWVTVVSSPARYNILLDEMKKNNGNTTLEIRKALALEAFKHTGDYDKAIYNALGRKLGVQECKDKLELSLCKVQDLRYGENPHQCAAYYTDSVLQDNNLPFKVLQGKELSYNNFVDITAALNIINEFKDVSASCIIKHNNPCGVAIADNALEAYKKAFNSDPISAFGGIVSLNREVDNELAQLMSSFFLEAIVAPSFSEEAKSTLAQKKNLRLIEIEPGITIAQNYILKQVVGGILVQSLDTKEIKTEDLQIVSQKKPTKEQINDMLFAWKVAKHVSSNAIVIAKNAQTLGIGCGQTSRIASMEIALRQACDEAKDAVVASDGFFPAIDNISAAAQSRVAAIIQPGGSIKDKDVITMADKLELVMVLTGIRHFRH